MAGTPPQRTLPWLSDWRSRLVTALVRYTPLRSLTLRTALVRASGAFARARRRRLEARRDPRLSRPAQWGMDVRLAELIGGDGYFVEAGANDGYAQSNTYYLERFHGWRGLLVEPIPSLAAEARRNRPDASVVECALTSPSTAGRPMAMLAARLLAVATDSEQADTAPLAFARGDADVRRIEVPARTL